MTENSGTIRKRSDLSSASSEKSTNSPSAKRFSATMEQDLTLATIWEVLKRIETNTNLMLEEQKTLKKNYEELRASFEFTQAKVDSVVKENED